MKDLSLLVWLTQLGLSVAVPLAAFVWLGVWLHRSCQWGLWTVWAGIALGLYSAGTGLWQTLQLLQKQSKDEAPHTTGFNEHQ